MLFYVNIIKTIKRKDIYIYIYMKQLIKILAGGFLTTTALTATVITPIEVIKHNNNQMTVSNVNNNKTIIKNNMNMNSVLSKIPESKIDSIINNYYGTNLSKTGSMLLQETTNLKEDKIVVTKAKEIANKLYTNKISLSSLRQEDKNRFNNLTPEQKAYIKNKILEESKTHLTPKPLMFSYPDCSLLSENQSCKNQINNFNQYNQELEKKLFYLEVFAGTLTALAIAATIVAAVQWTIWFIGWAEAAFTTAAVAADWAAVGLAWQSYFSSTTDIQNLFAATSAATSGLMSCVDVVNYLKDSSEETYDAMYHWIKQLAIARYAALGANEADLWADPSQVPALAALNGLEEWFDVINAVIDSAETVFGCVDMNIATWNN